MKYHVHLKDGRRVEIEMEKYKITDGVVLLISEKSTTFVPISEIVCVVPADASLSGKCVR